MRTLPTTMIRVLVPFAPLFSKRVWQHVQVLLTGSMLAPGKRTVASALRAVGLQDERRFCRYHRVLSRAAWSAREASRILLRLLVEAFVPDGPLGCWLLPSATQESRANGIRRSLSGPGSFCLW